MSDFRVICGDAFHVLPQLPAESVHCCVTSPPYWRLRDYGVAGQLGLEKTPDEYVARIVEVFREVKRVLRNDGTLWLNLGDSYAGSWGAQSRADGNDIGSTLQGGSMLSARQIEAHPKLTNTGSLKNTPGLKAKDLVGIPWRVAFALQADGWYLRSDIIWSKPNPMPESVTDRPTKAHEYLFLLAKSERYFYDAAAIAKPVRSDTPGKWPAGWNGDPESRHDTIVGRYTSGQKERKYGEAVDRPTSHLGRSVPGTDDGAGRNKRSVWTVTTKPYADAHFAVFPPELIEPCILAGTAIGGTVLDPFTGSGTTGATAIRHGRNFIGIELNPKYIRLARRRCANAPLSLFEPAATNGKHEPEPLELEL